MSASLGEITDRNSELEAGVKARGLTSAFMSNQLRTGQWCLVSLSPLAKTGMTPLKYAVFGEVDDDADSDYDPEQDETKSVS
jgi:hypothetical protein